MPPSRFRSAQHQRHRRLVSLVLVAAGLGAASAAWADGRKAASQPSAPAAGAADRVYAGATALASRGLHDLAAAEFRAFLRAHPDHAQAAAARYGLALCLYRQSDFAAAADELSPLAAQREFEFAPEVLAMLGHCRLAQGKPAQAVELLERLLRDHADHELAAGGAALLVEALFAADQPERALAEARRFAQRHPKHAGLERVGYFEASILTSRGDPSAAARWTQWLKAFGDGPLAPQARMQFGRLLLEAGDAHAAQRQFEQAEKQSREAAEGAAYWMARCALKQGDFAAAAGRLEEALGRRPDGPLAAEMRYDRAFALAQQKDQAPAAAAAVSDFLRRHAGHALTPDALYLLATLQNRQRDFDASLSACRKLQTDYASHALAPAARLLECENLLAAERFDDAVAALAAFLKAHPDDPQADAARLRLGLTLCRLQRWEEAQPPLAAVAGKTAKQPEFAPALLALGDVHLQRSEWKPAAEALEQYLAGDPRRPGADEALLKLAVAQQRLDPPDAAGQTLRRLLKEFPDSPQRPRARYELGLALARQGREKDAAAQFELVTREGDAALAALALQQLAARALKREDFAGAAERFASLAERTLDAALACQAGLSAAQALLSAGKFADARERIDKLLSANPEPNCAAAARVQRAVALARLAESEAALREIVELRRGGGLARVAAEQRAALAYEEAWCLRKLGNDAEAMKAYERLLKDDPDGPRSAAAGLELAELEAAAGQCDAATQRLDSLVARRKPPSSVPADLLPRVIYRLAACDLARERFEAAAERLERWLTEYPDHALSCSAGLLCGEANSKLGRFKRAAEQLARVCERCTGDASVLAPALLRLGQACAELQQWPRSQKAFADYLKLVPDGDQWAAARFGLGWALENQGRHADAIAAYQLVVERGGGAVAARAQFQIGECLFAQNKLDTALRELLKVEALYASPEWSAAALYEAGRVLEKMDRRSQAREQYAAVREKHSTTRWAELAEQRLKALPLASADLPGR